MLSTTLSPALSHKKGGAPAAAVVIPKDAPKPITCLHCVHPLLSLVVPRSASPAKAPGGPGNPSIPIRFDYRITCKELIFFVPGLHLAWVTDANIDIYFRLKESAELASLLRAWRHTAWALVSEKEAPP